MHFIEFAVLLPLRGRARLSAPLQWRVRSAILPGNLQLPMALATRKGHAASVRRQSRQRLRSERRYIFLSRSRRYRRNRSVRFYRHLERTGSAFPRLPRRFAPRNDNSEVHTILTMACTDRQHCAGPGCPLPTTHGRRPAYFSFFIFQFSGFISMRPLPYNAFPAALRKIPRSAFHVFFHKFSLSCA